MAYYQLFLGVNYNYSNGFEHTFCQIFYSLVYSKGIQIESFPDCTPTAGLISNMLDSITLLENGTFPNAKTWYIEMGQLASMKNCHIL